jgi:hypothetical protein
VIHHERGCWVHDLVVDEAHRGDGHGEALLDALGEWADERDVIIRFTNETRELYAGERYPLRELDGSPKYTKEFDGLRREQDDLKGQAMARSEQSKHLEAKGEALGVYSTDINMQVDGDVDHSVELDEETAAAIREATLDDE